MAASGLFQHRALLHARLPRMRCPEHEVRQVSVPWARPGSGFTLLFEALVLSFVAAMPMAKVAAMTREHDTTIWRVVEHHVHAARDQLDCSGVRRVGVDETSARKGQDYVSIFADLDARGVVFATEGRCVQTVVRFAADLAEHGGDPEKVTDTSSDMSTAFISGITQHLPNVTMTFDRYHLAAKLSEAIDAVRRQEVATRPELKHIRWLWLKNYAHFSVAQRHELHHLMRPSAQLATARALRLAPGLPSLLRPAPQLRTRVPAMLVLRRETLPPATDQRLRHPGGKPLGRHHRLAHKPPEQRPARRD
ncbi:MAG TPA: ISL3 family transposase [Pseudonocardiaceae bacterium]|nr:ISL3 family transposase [Pseudonocardiaceae bacterium]